jgi:hypothetical protein
VEARGEVTRELRDLARLALAVIRSVNGLLALFTPKFLLRKLEVDPDENGAAIYALRMFGIRTAFLGAELFMKEGRERERALQTGTIIHASDTISAAIVWARGYLPRRAAAVATIISCINTVLALAAQDRTWDVLHGARDQAEAWAA